MKPGGSIMWYNVSPPRFWRELALSEGFIKIIVDNTELSDLFLKTKGITFFRFPLFFFFSPLIEESAAKSMESYLGIWPVEIDSFLSFHLLDSMMTWFHITLSCKDKDGWLQIRAVCRMGMRDRGRGIRREGGRPQPILGLVNSPTFPYAAHKFHPGPRWSYTCHLDQTMATLMRTQTTV